MSGDSQPKNSWAQGNFNDGITAVADPTPGTSPEDGTLHSQDVAAGGGHSRDTLDTAQPGSLEQAHQHIPGACGPIIEQASEDVLAIGDELYDESPPVEKLGTGEQASMFSLNLSASCKPRQNHEVTLEETRKGSLEEAHQHTPGACDSIIEQASEDLLAIGNELYDESPPVEKLGTGEQASMFSLNLSASRKPRQNHVPAYEVTPEETRKALKMIRSSVEANPNALGISLIVSHQDVHPDIAYSQSQSMEENRRQKRLNSLEGIEHGAQQLEEAFTMRGLTVVRLVNPTKKELFAVIRAMTLDRADPMAIEYPASYQYFFFYTTGHGANKVFFTKDGSISYQEVYDLYQGFLHQRYFFFDCCRSNRLDSLSVYPNGDHVIPPCPDFSLSHNNRVIFATLSGHQACGPQGEGVSFMTKKMVVLLKKQIPMDKVLARLHEELPKEVKEKTGQFQQVMNVDSTPRRIDLWQEQKQALKPKLQVTPHLSPDSAVVYHTVEFPPPTTTSEFHQQETLQFQMKSQSGAWINLSEYKETSDSVSIPQAARPRASTTTTASQPSYVPLEDIASYERGRDLVHSFRPGHSNSNQQATNVSQVTRVLKIPVSEVGIRVAEFRVVLKLNGGLELESNTVLGIVNLVQPVICKSDSVIEFEGSQEPQVSISWSIRQVPLTISYLQFIVRVYKKGDPNPVLSEDIDFEPQKEHYKESFDMPGLSDDTKGGDYLVVVEAKRADGQTVCSERIPLETAKGCCYHLSLRCLVGFVFFFLFGTAIITLLSSMIGTNTSEKNEHRYNASAMLSYTTLGIPTAQRNASFFNCLLHFDYKNEQVIKHKDIDLYCGQFTKFQLANSRTPKFWGPNDIAINQRNKKLEVPVDFLPIGSTVPTAINLLPRSIFSVYLCLSAPVDGTIVFQLYRYEDLPHIATSEPLQRNAVTFERSTSCNYSSNTSINVLEHNLVIGALSTNSTAHPEFTRIQGYVQQYYYDEKHLGLINDTYLVGDQPKTIPGSIETELVCYANGDRSRTVFLHLFSVLVPTALTLWKVIVIATTALVLVVAFIFCVFRRTLVRFVCNQYRQCRQRCGHNSYIKLNN